MSRALMQRPSVSTASRARATSRATTVVPLAARVIVVPPQQYRSPQYRPVERRQGPSPFVVGLGMAGATLLASEWLKRQGPQGDQQQQQQQHGQRTKQPSTVPGEPTFHLGTSDTEYTLSADVPGAGDEDLYVEVSPEGVLTITGTQLVRAPGRHHHHDDDADAARQWYAALERAVGRGAIPPEEARKLRNSSAGRVKVPFERAFQLPEDAEADRIMADLDRGVLNVSIPRRVQQRPQNKRINVQRKASDYLF